MNKLLQHIIKYLSLLLFSLTLAGSSFAATPKQVIDELSVRLKGLSKKASSVKTKISDSSIAFPSNITDARNDIDRQIASIQNEIDALPNSEKGKQTISPEGVKTANKITDDLDSLDANIGRLQSDVEEAIRLSKIEPQPFSLGLVSYLTNSLVFWSVAGIIALALLLHFLHLFGATATRKQLEELKANVKQLARATVPGNTGSAAVTGLAEQLLQQGQSVQQLSGQVQQIDQRLSLNERDDQDLADSIVRITRWIGDDELRSASASNGNQMDDGTRRAMLQVIERNREPLSANAARTEPLKQAFSVFITRLNGLPQLPPELMTRARNLQSDIEVFSNWQRDVDSEFNALQLGSTRARQSRLYAEHDKLIAQLENRQISISDHIEQYRRVLDYYLSTGPSNTDTAAPMEYETELRNRASGATDLLMDWFDGLFQLYILSNSLARATPPAFEPEALTELSQVQKVARDVLSKFDVQPEEIQVGRTSYDRRLHEAALIRQSGQVPANTVIGVQRCGFRRVSTGEVLRRPHVVVAGASAG